MPFDATSRISVSTQKLPFSPIRRFFGLLESIPDAISLSIGEPDFVTPRKIRDAAMYALEEGHTHYTHNLGLIELRREIANYLDTRFGMQYDPSCEILVSVGVSEGLDLTMRAILNANEKVLIPQPAYVAYPAAVTLAGGVPVSIPTNVEDNFQLTAETFEKAIVESGAKTALIGYPCNPTGAILPKERLESLAEVAINHDLLVISDEIYLELTYGRKPVSFAALPGMRERTVLLSGFSKAFAMTGWRLGYIAGPADLIAAINKIHGYTCMAAPTIAQFGAIEALRSCIPDVEAMRDEYDTRRKYIVGQLRDMGLSCFEPEGAFYAFPSIAGTGLTSMEFAERLLSEEGVAVVPGSGFGECGEGFIRCCYATSKPMLEEAIKRMRRFVSKLA